MLRSTFDKICFDIEMICKWNFNLIPIIILNRKNDNCFGVYIKGRKDLGIGIGNSSDLALEDLRNKVRQALKSIKKL